MSLTDEDVSEILRIIDESALEELAIETPSFSLYELQAKALGARWDREKKSWYAPPGADLLPLAKWTADRAAPPTRVETTGQRQAIASTSTMVKYAANPSSMSGIAVLSAL